LDDVGGRYSDIEHGVNNVEDYVTGYIRTNKASISFDGAWAENIAADAMFIDFMGDKGGAHLNYGGLYSFFDGDTLKEERPQYDIPNMYLKEDEAFFDSIRRGEERRATSWRFSKRRNSWMDSIRPPKEKKELIFK
jgi:predicted dehydrogenase